MLSYFAYLTSFLTDRLRRDDRGASLVEYGLLLGLIAVIAIPVLVLLGPAIANMFQQVLNAL
jgi:pilus assembly protein Flp/PilA